MSSFETLGRKAPFNKQLAAKIARFSKRAYSTNLPYWSGSQRDVYQRAPSSIISALIPTNSQSFCFMVSNSLLFVDCFLFFPML